MIVYALIDPRTGEERYVGKTLRNAAQRLNEHIADDRYNGHKKNWIEMLRRLGHRPGIKVIQECASIFDLNAAEIAHISRLRELGARLINETDGGDGRSQPHTPESRAKIASKLKGRKYSVETRRKMSESRIGSKHSKATRLKMSASRSKPRGPMSDRHKLILSRAHGGKTFYDQHGNRYLTQMGAARRLRINVSHINQVLHGERRHTHGYIFRFEEN